MSLLVLLCVLSGGNCITGKACAVYMITMQLISLVCQEVMLESEMFTSAARYLQIGVSVGLNYPDLTFY